MANRHNNVTEIMGTLKLFFLLANGSFSHRDGFNKRKTRIKFVLRSVLTLPWTLRWLNILNQNAQLRQYLSENPRLVLKLHRPYLYRSLGIDGKLLALATHYRILEMKFRPAFYLALLHNERITIAKLHGKNDVDLIVVMTQRHGNDREGELCLQLCSSDGISIGTLTFTVHLLEGEIAITIGGLQGAAKPFGADEVRDATKSCHGLFPKRLLIEALMAVAHHVEAKQVLAVSKREHMYGSLRYRRDFRADYDQFWEILNGQINAKGLYVLPLHLPRKSMEKIASKKRSEYQRRHQLLDDLVFQISQTLQTMKVSKLPTLCMKVGVGFEKI